MCEADAYMVQDEHEQMIMGSVDLVQPDGDGTWRLVNIFGEQITIRGRIKIHEPRQSSGPFRTLGASGPCRHTMTSAGPRAFFDTRAKGWERNCYPPQVRRRLGALVETFGLCNDEWVLDVGTGTGILFPYLHRRIGDSGQVCAFDLSFEMISSGPRRRI